MARVAEAIEQGEIDVHYQPIVNARTGQTLPLSTAVLDDIGRHDLLTKDDDRGLRRYRRFLHEEFASYLQMRSRCYAEERRWPESEFWQRRSPAPDRRRA